ncbi:MAG: hypothetical protein CO093_02450 [Alphaproteobacteria bacterium CG_4_9_14_3_um_filter_47_13]|nr:MAG: hypothetical protein CO093_02450 [Alphaproteobacteria bacterium CG_4_9_14_3_um_filter_47_13]
MTPVLKLFFIIFIEGYVVLSTELLAIRLLIPFTGSGTDTISIIVAAVLMPLAFGYYAGGQFKTRHHGRHRSTIRKKLIRNLLISSVILSAGLSYLFLVWLIDTFLHFSSFRDRFSLTFIYAVLFLVYPVFLLGQTVPLVSNYFPKDRLPVMAGRILFVSTLGSFMGAVFCTLALMAWIGVHYTAVVTIGCMTVLVMLLSKKIISREVLAAVGCFIFALVLNSGFLMKSRDIVADNKYHTIAIKDFGQTRTMMINHNMSSAIHKETGGSTFTYIQYIERTFIDPLLWRPGLPHDILVVGAGGFTVGITDKKNNYIYIDIDKDMQKIAETYFLEQKLTPNKSFVPVPARAYLHDLEKKFDLIILDAFRGPSKTPEHLVTLEFFEQIKKALKPDGVMVANYVVSASFSDDFSINLDNTIRFVFKNINRMPLGNYDGWDRRGDWGNILYVYTHHVDAPENIYTDDKNKSLFDKPVHY